MKHAKRVSGINCLSLNLLDVLTGIPTLKICVGYKLNGKKIDYYPASLKELDNCEPIYEELPGWDKSITEITKFSDLPVNAQQYINKITELTGIKVATISVGADRIQTIIVDDPWNME